MTDGFRSQIDRISTALPRVSKGARRRAAISSWAAMVGAVVLARAINDPALSAEVLDQTRDWIKSQILRR
jgi:TetR/AcrR family transcriptional regulator, transcriptional repressor for nem operon